MARANWDTAEKLNSPASTPAADEQLAVDCLQLARLGLRSIDDPKMVASIRAIDTVLRTDTPSGPVWHRHTDDHYGEHADGTPFDGTGIGRGWPLLTGERGHAALLAGEDAGASSSAMSNMTGRAGLLPEQIWDSDAIATRGLYPGKPSGAAMPLVLAHAEFIKLALSVVAGVPVDRPTRTWARYQGRPPVLDYVLWLPSQPASELVVGQELRLLFPESCVVHWGTHGWGNTQDIATEDWGLGHVARLPTRTLAAGEVIDLTVLLAQGKRWQGTDYLITVIARL